MENPLSMQSKKLIEKLNIRKGLTLKELNATNNYENTISNDNLLLNANNMRPNKVKNTRLEHNITDSFPKSSITSIMSRSAYLSKSEESLSKVSSVSILSENMPKRLPFGITDTTSHLINTGANNSRFIKNSDLLGYDWIVGMLENKTKECQLDKPPEYFEELDRFRRQNKQLCISADNREWYQLNKTPQAYNSKNMFNDVTPDIYCIPSGPSNNSLDEQPQVYAYTLNERLFPVPLDLETASRGVPDSKNPHIIKVSIPSNRFLHRNEKIQSMKDKTSTLTRPMSSENSNLGESLSLSSHCHPASKISPPVSQNDKFHKSISSSRQEPAGLIGNIVHDSNNPVYNSHENTAWFGHIQPKTEKEAIEQLKRGKTGAIVERMIPSSLENRHFNIESLQSPQNICQTRIALKDLVDDCNPRISKPFPVYKCQSNSDPITIDETLFNGDGPRFSLSRKEMSKVYVDEIENVINNAKL